MKRITDFQKLSLPDLLTTLCSEQALILSELDIHNSLKRLSSNFKVAELRVVLKDILKFGYGYFKVEYESKVTTVETLYKESVISSDIIRNVYNDADTFDKGLIYHVDYEKSIADFDTGCLVYCIDAKIVDADIVKYQNLVRYTQEVEEVLYKLYEENKITNEPQERPQQEFNSLFRIEYRNNIPLLNSQIELFKSWLNRELFINSNNEVIVGLTNFTRIYYLMKDIGLLDLSISNSKSVKLFLKEFGINVVEKLTDKGNEITTRTTRDERTKDYTMLTTETNAYNFHIIATKELSRIFAMKDKNK